MLRAGRVIGAAALSAVVAIALHPSRAVAQRVLRSDAVHSGVIHRTPRRRTAGARRVAGSAVGLFGLAWGSDTTDVNGALSGEGFFRLHAAKIIQRDYLISDGSTLVRTDYVAVLAGLPVILDCHFREDSLRRVAISVDGGATPATRRAAYGAVLHAFTRDFGPPSEVVPGLLRQAMWSRTPDGAAIYVIEGAADPGTDDPSPAVMITVLPAT